MARKYFKKRSYRKRTFRKRTRGKYSLKKTVKRILNTNTETKYNDIASENVQLYHNVGVSGGALVPVSQYSDPTFFNPWATIPPGTGRANRIGDKIKPLSMTVKLWLANKLDRPNIMYRIIVARLPKSIGASLISSSNLYLFQGAQTGFTGNTMILPCDHDKGVKPYYDRVINVQYGFSSLPNGSNGGKELHKYIRLKIKRKSSSNIIFDSTAQNIVNSPLALYIIPYDSYGSLVTDNIASYSMHARMYYKDA